MKRLLCSMVVSVMLGATVQAIPAGAQTLKSKPDLARMDFRGLTEDAFKPGVAVSVVAYPSKQIRDEVRAENITIGGKSFELR